MHLSVFAEPTLRTSRNDRDVARAADPLFGAEAELHLALEHPNDLLICVTVRLDMDAAPIAVSSLHAAALCAAVSQARAEFRWCHSLDEQKLLPNASSS